MKDKEKAMAGHGFERANICADCKGPLKSEDGHFHSRLSRKIGAEPTCCDCAIAEGRTCHLREPLRELD